MTEPTTELPFVSDTLPVVSGYRLECLAGSGGMARVYRATEEGLDRPVAIKVLCAHGGDSISHQARFEREARLVATLQHPNIVSIYRVTRTRNGDPCIVMPWLTGSLADRSLPLPEIEARSLLAALLDALGHAHAAHIIHRDLKPDNVLFDVSGRPLLADFGVALQMGGDARLTGEGLAVGSARYMSPEQALGREVDARSDLYSLGVLAYEVLVGVPPFVATDAIAAALAHVEAAVPRLPDTLSHWQLWMDRVLAKAPSDRFTDAQQMRAALPGRSASDSSPGQPLIAVRPHGTPLRLAMSVVGLLLLSLGVWLLLRITAEPDAAALDAPIASVPFADPPAIAQPLVAEPATPPTAELTPPSPGALYARFRDLDGPWMVRLPSAGTANPSNSVAISQSEITREQYARFIAASARRESHCAGGNWREPGYPQADDHPVVCVSFADATAYAAWLSGLTGETYRLPRMAEWNRLTRPVRGQTPACDQAQLSGSDCVRSATTSVESHIAVEPGVFGLIGNVREWTGDCSWQINKANPVTHGLRGVGRWIQRKESVPRETRTCIGRKVIGSGFADQTAWPLAQSHAESSAFADLGFRLIREN
jgi:serine/threonine protein kinase